MKDDNHFASYDRNCSDVLWLPTYIYGEFSSVCRLSVSFARLTGIDSEVPQQT